MMEIKTEGGDDIEIKPDTDWDDASTGLIWLDIAEDHTDRPNDPTGGAATTLTPSEARQLAAELTRLADLLDSNPSNT